MNSRDALAWLYQSLDFGIKLGLDNTRRLLDALGIEPASEKCRIVHVAGTNGKGSVCAFTNRILTDAGLRVGLFTSPHLVNYRERIRVADELISDEGVAEGLTKIRDLSDEWENQPTFFEITLALAMWHFQEQACEVIILETGMGGRFDATNALSSTVSVITSIGLDHQKWLGDTITEIAGEKAGIIKPDTPVIIGDLVPEAREVVGRAAIKCGVPCVEVHPLPEGWQPGLAGRHQYENAALAVEAACRVAGDQLTREGIEKSVAETKWPGRFEKRKAGRWIVDGAHNVAAAEALTEAWRGEFGDTRALVFFSGVADKDLCGIARALAPIAEEFHLVKMDAPRAASFDELEQAVAGLHPGPFPRYDSVSEAVSTADMMSGPALWTGSLFFIGELTGILDSEPSELISQ
ncbi:MAG: folylpolyglutamate synthase/dihydrofolate synthase family protein [Verrucomicrobiota bacterium]